jgi:hypothetical protein
MLACRPGKRTSGRLSALAGQASGYPGPFSPVWRLRRRLLARETDARACSGQRPVMPGFGLYRRARPPGWSIPVL